MNEEQILLALHETKGIGWVTLSTLREKLGSFKPLLDMELADLQQAGIPRRMAGLIKQGMRQEGWSSIMEGYERDRVQVVTCFDERYPPLLKHIAKPPWVLYCKGDISMLQKPSIAVVGARKPSGYGRRAAHELACALSQAGLTVVSGLARGIDSLAHLGAIEEKGGTIAILGSALDRIYPPEHHTLFERIARHGLVVSEFPRGISAKEGHFPMRNRIIAGMTYGTLVVEAASSSGSLNTVEHASEYGREVFAVPGSMYAVMSQGTNNLIKTGAAKLTTDANDIFCEFRQGFSWVNHIVAAREEEESPLTPDEARIIDFLSAAPRSFDELLEHFRFSFGHLHSVLLSLQMKNKIEQKPNSTYASV